MVEQRSPKPPVVGSSPACPDFFNKGNCTMAKVIQFFKESKAELKKVVWPTKEDVFSSIKVVVISTIIVAVVLGLLDVGFSSLFRWILSLV